MLIATFFIFFLTRHVWAIRISFDNESIIRRLNREGQVSEENDTPFSTT